MAGKLVLHIGSTKTGTSAIQSALVRNREALRARGVLVPHGRRDDKAEAGRVTGGNGWILHAFKAQFDKHPNIALKRLNARLSEVADDASGDTVIFSGEALGGYEARHLAELKPVLEQYFDEVQIVYFVRHLTDHAISRYSEYVKRRRLRKSFPEFAPSYEAPFKTALESYEAVFGREAITCLLYEDVRDRIFDTFLETIDVPSDGMEIPKSVNRSLTADEIEVFRTVNAKGFDGIQVAKVIEDFAFNNPKIGRSFPYIPQASIDAIEENHRDLLGFVNERLVGPSRLQAASDDVLAIARGGDEAGEKPFNPDIVLGVLESSLRMSDIRIKEMKEKLKASEAARRKATQRLKAALNAPLMQTFKARLIRKVKRILSRGRSRAAPSKRA